MSPEIKVTETRTRFGTSNRDNEDVYVTRPMKVVETSSRFGPETKTVKKVEYTTYQPSRARHIEETGPSNNNKRGVYVVSEKRKEQYSNDNGKERKYVQVEQTLSDGSKRSATLYADNK
jgi:hypothetical protein